MAERRNRNENPDKRRNKTSQIIEIEDAQKRRQEKRRGKASQNIEIEEAQKRRQEKRRDKASQIIEIEEAQKRRQEKRAEQLKQEKVLRRREKAIEKANRPKMSRAKKLTLCGVLAIAFLVFIFNGYRIIDLNLNKAVYEKEYEEKLAEKARLEKELSLVDDPEYVEQQARSRFHMIREGELLYVFPEKAAPEAQ